MLDRAISKCFFTTGSVAAALSDNYKVFSLMRVVFNAAFYPAKQLHITTAKQLHITEIFVFKIFVTLPDQKK